MGAARTSRPIIAAAVVGCAVALLGLAGCGSGEETTTAATGQVELKLEQPSQPLAIEGTSIGIRLMRDGETSYSGDFWKLPKGRENPATGTTTYDLETLDLDAGDYPIAAVVRVCGGSGCSDADLGEPASRCQAHFQVHADALTTLAVVVRGLDRPCGFAVTPG